MVFEIVEINVKPGTETAFEAGVAEAQALFKRAKGCKSMSLRKSVEKSGHYRLFVEWQDINDHLVDFKNSEDINEWRRLVGQFFASPPEIEHFVVVNAGF